MDLATITAESMRPLQGREFTLVGHDVTLTLTEIDEPDGPGGARFSLLFDGPLSPQLQQGVWRMALDGDELAPFLVPIGPRPGGGMGYEAVFAR